MKIEEIERGLLRDIERLRTPQGYLNAGHPRYHTLFGRDALISGWQLLDSDPSVARAGLAVLAELQGRTYDAKREEEPGKILHEHRTEPKEQDELPEWAFPYYGSVDSTPLFLILAERYLCQSGDRPFLEGLWPALEAAYRWMTRTQDTGGGLLRYERRNPHGLMHQGWKDGFEDHLKIRPPVAIVEAQAYAYTAYCGFRRLARALSKGGFDEDAADRGRQLERRVNEEFWMPREGSYVLGLDGKGHARQVVTTNAGHLLFTGIVPPNRRERLASRLFRDDVWTRYGLRTHSTEDEHFDPFGYHTGSVWPHDNWLVAMGLRKSGFPRRAAKIRDALLRAYRTLGKIPELYAVVDGKIVDLSEKPVCRAKANPLQAWASAGLLELIRWSRETGRRNRTEDP
jgi:glycogen debranching enzyme